MSKTLLNTIKFLFFISAMPLFLQSCKDKSKTESTAVSDESVEIVNSDNENNLNDSKSEQLVGLKDQSKMNPAQVQIQKLLESCVKNDYETAAKAIMYRGNDESRKGKDAFSMANPQEANTVKVTCDVIKQWLGESENYDFISYQELEIDLIEQHVVEVMFKKAKLGVNRHFFYLVDTPKGMLLVNMI